MPVAPRKICYNFAMWERENNFLGPFRVFQKISKIFSWGHLHALYSKSVTCDQRKIRSQAAKKMKGPRGCCCAQWHVLSILHTAMLELLNQNPVEASSSHEDRDCMDFEIFFQLFFAVLCAFRFQQLLPPVPSRPCSRCKPAEVLSLTTVSDRQ